MQSMMAPKTIKKNLFFLWLYYLQKLVDKELILWAEKAVFSERLDFFPVNSHYKNVLLHHTPKREVNIIINS